MPLALPYTCRPFLPSASSNHLKAVRRRIQKADGGPWTHTARAREGLNEIGRRKCHRRNTEYNNLQTLTPKTFFSFYFLYTPSNPPAQLSLLCFTSVCSALIKVCLVVLKFSLAIPALMAADSPLSSSLIQTDRLCFFSSAVAAEHRGRPVHENKQERDH